MIPVGDLIIRLTDQELIILVIVLGVLVIVWWGCIVVGRLLQQMKFESLQESLNEAREELAAAVAVNELIRELLELAEKNAKHWRKLAWHLKFARPLKQKPRTPWHGTSVYRGLPEQELNSEEKHSYRARQ